MHQGDEWEEKWGEKYWGGGRASKYADKWGKEGVNVWHERWGEDYDGAGGCLKWTDKVRIAHLPSPMTPADANVLLRAFDAEFESQSHMLHFCFLGFQRRVHSQGGNTQRRLGEPSAETCSKMVDFKGMQDK